MNSGTRLGAFDRLEVVYLNVLRVVILVLATVFLAAAILATVNAIPKLIPDAKEADARALVSADSLKDFQAAQAGQTAPADSEAPDASADQEGKIDSRIKKAAASLAAHLRSPDGTQPPVGPVEAYLSEKQLALPQSLQGDYADSLVKLMESLASSSDRSVDADQLIDWHYAKFQQATEAATQLEAERAVKNAQNLQAALVAGGAAVSAFFLFLIVVFGFVLVKIERNLRRVSVLVLKDDETPVADQVAQLHEPVPQG